MTDPEFEKIKLEKAGIKISLEFSKESDLQSNIEKRVREILYNELKERLQCL